jgi:hypothetical protein
MTEFEWLHYNIPEKQLKYVFDRLNPSQRRLRLFVCALCWHTHYPSAPADRDRYLRNSEQNRRAIDIGERYADGMAGEAERERAYLRLDAAEQRFWEEGDGGDRNFAWAARACVAPKITPTEAKPGLQTEVTPSTILKDIFGNPFRPAAFDPSWLTSTVVSLATGIYKERAFDRLPILADALQDAGCENEAVLSHCRGDLVHVRGCWVVDLVLGKS